MQCKNPAAVALGRKGGKVKSAAKTAAVRANGAMRKRSFLPCIRCGTGTITRDASRRADCGCRAAPE